MNKRNNEYLVAVLTKIIMVFIGLAESVLLARYLGVELRGQVSYINSIVQTGYIIATLGIYTAYPYFRKNGNKESILNRIMSVTLAMFLFYCFVATIAAVVLNNNKEWFYIVIVLPILFYDKVISFLWMIEEPNKRNTVVLITALAKLTYYGLLFLFAPKTLIWGVTTLVIAPLIESLYFTAKIKYKFSWKYLKPKSVFPLISYGFMPMIAVLLTTLNYRIDVIMLRKFSFISLEDIGVYSIGITLAEKVLLISDAVKEILLSKLAKGKGEQEVAKVMRLCFLISLIMAIFVTIISKMFISFLYGSEYSGAEAVTNISVWGTIFMVFFRMISQYNVANRRQTYNVIFLGIAIILNIGLNNILIPVLGINGGALATSIGYCFSSLLFVIYFHRLSGISYIELIFIQKQDINNIIKIIKGVNK